MTWWKSQARGSVLARGENGAKRNNFMCRGSREGGNPFRQSKRLTGGTQPWESHRGNNLPLIWHKNIHFNFHTKYLDTQVRYRWRSRWKYLKVAEEHSSGKYIVKVVLNSVIPLPLLPLLKYWPFFWFEHRRCGKNLCHKPGEKKLICLLSPRAAGDEQLRWPMALEQVLCVLLYKIIWKLYSLFQSDNNFKTYFPLDVLHGPCGYIIPGVPKF